MSKKLWLRVAAYASMGLLATSCAVNTPLTQVGRGVGQTIYGAQNSGGNTSSVTAGGSASGSSAGSGSSSSGSGASSGMGGASGGMSGGGYSLGGHP